jgi:hypothetical protein
LKNANIVLYFKSVNPIPDWLKVELFRSVLPQNPVTLEDHHKTVGQVCFKDSRPPTVPHLPLSLSSTSTRIQRLYKIFKEEIKTY